MHPGPQVSSGADVTIRKPPGSSEKSCCAAASGKNRNVKRHLQSDPCDESRCLLAFRWCSLAARRTPTVRQMHFWSSPAAPVSCCPQSVWRRSEEHTSELQSHVNIVCRLLLEKKKKYT